MTLACSPTADPLFLPAISACLLIPQEQYLRGLLGQQQGGPTPPSGLLKILRT